MIGIFFAARNYIVIPDAINIFYFLISVFLAFFLAIAFNLIFHALTFRFGDQDASIELFNYIALFLAGAFFPLAFLPQNAFHIFSLLPFKNTFFVPIEIFLGKIPPSQIYLSWVETIIWTVIFYVIFKLIYKNGLKHYTGTGR